MSNEYKLTEHDLQLAAVNRGYTEDQFSRAINKIKDEAWKKGYESGHADGSEREGDRQ